MKISHISDTKFPSNFNQKKPIGNDLVLLILKEGFNFIKGKINGITLPPLKYKPEGIVNKGIIHK